MMKTTLFAAACVMALSTVGALAQSSQGDVGPGTANRPGSTNSGMMNNSTGSTGTNSGMSNTTGSGMSTSRTDMNNGTAANPSSQGNVGPGTTPGNPGSSTNTR